MLMISTDLKRAARRSDTDAATWTDEQLDREIDRYKRFLLLVADDPTRPVAPTRDIDALWHLHMLSPVAYHRDCMALLGFLLDHDGGFGREPSELPVLGRVFEDTASRWKAKYGESYLGEELALTKCWHDCQSRCWHACKSEDVSEVAA